MQNQNKRTLTHVAWLTAVAASVIRPDKFHYIYRSAEIGFGPFFLSGMGSIVCSGLLILNFRGCFTPDSRTSEVRIRIVAATLLGCMGNIPALLQASIVTKSLPWPSFGEFLFWIFWLFLIGSGVYWIAGLNDGSATRAIKDQAPRE